MITMSGPAIFPLTRSDPEVAAEFKRLTADWIAETRLLSNVVQIAMSEPYQRIIALGRPVVPLILEELRVRPRQWFWALRVLTGANPVPEDARGNVRRMAEAWINWGEENGLILAAR